MDSWGILFAALGYLLLLFVVASIGDRDRRKSRSPVFRSAIYALSLAVYCTSWTFFGSVGYAATSGLDFIGIYLGPVLMLTLGFPLMRHIVRVAKAERITSVADFLAARYGKNTTVGVVATIIAVLGTVPYIALQLKAISSSVDILLAGTQPSILAIQGAPVDTSVAITVLLAVFAIAFGTRHADATEHQGGLMMAVAMESIVKLVAFLAAGLFITFAIFDGFGDLVTQATESAYVQSRSPMRVDIATLSVFTLLSFCAFVLLPRQFHVSVVENHSMAELRTARWLFPLYLIAINLFVVPVAIGGLLIFGDSVNADGYLLALPLLNGSVGLSLLVFIGGLSAATAMVIVACVALAIMISNNLVLPLLLKNRPRMENGDPAKARSGMAANLLRIRRIAIFATLALAWIYYRVADDSAALISIGLLSFAAVAQFAPAFFIGLVWRRATALSALAGMLAGFSVWSYTLFVPTLLPPEASLMLNGPFGIEALRPQALFGVDAAPLNHGVFFSLLCNTVALVIATLWREAYPLEQVQAERFAISGQIATRREPSNEHGITIADLRHAVASYLGPEMTEHAMASFHESRGERPGNREQADSNLIAHAEQLLASAIGAASARLVMSLLLERNAAQGDSTRQLLNDASQALQQNHDLLRTALDQVQQGLCVFDSDLRLASWNRQFLRLLDLHEDEIVSGLPLDTMAAIINSRCGDTLSDDELTEALSETSSTAVLKLAQDGRILESVANPVPAGGLIISWSDTTERVAAAEALQTANETLENRVQQRTEELTRLNVDLDAAREAAEAADISKTKFLAAVGHDILQPLNAARLYTSSLVERMADTPEREMAGNVDSALESVEDILGAVLAISRLDAGVLAPTYSTFPVKRVLDRLETEFRPIADAKDLHFDVRKSDEFITSDFSLLNRMLQNLVSNAIKYTSVGDVELQVRRDADNIIFEVHDTGQGIDLESREAIFQEFRRLEGGKRAASGLGLGLSIVQRLATTLDHKLYLTSAPGEGSVFTVAVPRAEPLDLPVAQTQGQSKSRKSLTGLSVICIDNEPALLDGMRTLLSGWGCQVHTFEGSGPLLASLDGIDPQVLLADYHLNNEDGLSVISAVRERLGEGFPTVLVTADRSADIKQTTRDLDIALLNKPLKPAALRALLARHHSKMTKDAARDMQAAQ
ncbi:ATP-binding protein [Ahrensia sp. R2A130]|uniref:ATP-binding protein n=1 Tax=Ahrensia sp. R2A130 TaxID=744979 RepID=UPI0001E0E0B3|nr:ATP-binding protein [Ahrensia sp. R2A130]EFL89343.1 two-component sensor histidine kinase [Ahrensia sp. R2A130]